MAELCIPIDQMCNTVDHLDLRGIHDVNQAALYEYLFSIEIYMTNLVNSKITFTISN
jgi:hypothetical protein